MQRNTPISYLRTISSCPETKTIEEILSIIKNGSFELYNGMSLKDSIEEIRASNKGRRKKLKKGLPYFIPTVLLFDENILREDSIISGAVQFDVDLKDNEKINFDELKNDIIKIPEVIYAFTSPSGGLKFAIKTDFQKNKNDDAETLKAKYKQAYEVCKEYVSSFVNIKYDDSMKALKFPCFLSYDKEAYFNPACLVLEVNSDCIYEKPEEFNLSYDTNITTEQVEELLSYIPKDFDYDERLPINYAVFSSIGKAGVSILFNHWITDDRTKLKKDLISQSEEKKPLANLGFLIKTAVEYGYKVTTGTKRRYLEPKNSSHKFQPLLTTNEAKDKLEEIVNNFFQSKKSVFINISTGTGKTEEVLKILRNIPSNKNVLYLVESHELAEEIKERFYKIEVKNKLGINSSIVHIKGRNKTCERSDIADKYNKANMSIPSLQCEEGCPHKCKCNYSFQFAKKANIRLMTHNEFMNEKSIWSSGYDPLTNSPKKKGWKADYIIIDEDYFQFQNYHEKLDNEYDGIRNIINHIANKTLGKSKAIGSAEFFLEAVKEHESDILADFQRMNSNKPNKITFKNTDDYIRQTKKQSGKRQSEILKLLNLYVLTSDKKFLNSIWFENNKLKHSRLKSVADHYKDIPTLYLDATANESVIKTVLPDVEFHSIKVESKEDINIYQLQNRFVYKGWFEDEKNRDEIIYKIKELIKDKNYEKVGLITYMNINGIKNFDKWLGNEIGVETYAHFGNLRGLDKFKDVDCLLVVGRHFIPEQSILEYSRALYADVINEKEYAYENSYVDKPVRMKDGTTKTLNNSIYVDGFLENAKNHFCTSETIQAIGRGRLVYGKKKDVYYFSNQSLGGDVEITNFFKYEDFYEKPKYQDEIITLKQLGFCKDKSQDLIELGFKNSPIKNHRSEIERVFLEAGVEKISFLHNTKNNRNYREQKYYTYPDPSALIKQIESEGGRIRNP